MIDVHQNATFISETFEGKRSRVIGNRCKNKQAVSNDNSFSVLNQKINVNKLLAMTLYSVGDVGKILELTQLFTP